MRKNKIIWGVIFLLCAAGILLFALYPGYSAAFGIQLWKFFFAVPLFYCVISNVVSLFTGKRHFTIALPLALLFLLFERNFAILLGKPADFINNWLLLLGAILIDIGFKCIFPKKKNYTHKVSEFTSTMKRSTHYLDATKGDHSISNEIGSAVVYFQNTDAVCANNPVRLHVSNDVGSVTVHVPQQWCVNCNIDNSLGKVDCRTNVADGAPHIFITGENNVGRIEIVSP